ncbi:CheR family methyltransferase [Histidinibacterium aquaticum]|uniref:Chemotaxis protein CheB n=1 Tax=Histidinibacterium aquaticum TaxID=2613962 RepID=A0A5J5GPU3_9RHOB|nr:CheR family methyltransferase [Histidinibacterium aquaticum]KAA9009763.1 chemotaxis protein CheB [Histidinibacterium aquaticum]
MNDESDRPAERRAAADEVDASRLCIVGIGASAGGLEAISDMLAMADPDSNLAYVVIQHLDPDHESLLAEILSRKTRLEVHQSAGGETVERGRVYIIPPGHGMTIVDGRLRLTEFAQPRGLRRPVDDFFESLAEDQGRYAACVILSGTGADGSAGLRAIKENEGLCIIQDPASARYDGMPQAAQATGLVDFIRSPTEIFDCLQRYYSHMIMTETDSDLQEAVRDNISEICSVLMSSSGHDFSDYKKTTLVRRIERRIKVLNLQDAGDYLDRIRADPEEANILFRELLINVTRFFRDPEQFQMLRQKVIAPIVRRKTDEPLRVWVAGCSSGEEAYTLAMIIADELKAQKKTLDVSIFATDIDEQMLQNAREAIYPMSALVDVPEELRETYTIAREGHFQIPARIRDMVRFSAHNVTRDPPFSSVDLISCRNLLIYFDDRLQKATLPTFQYALRPDGYLFLGPSETIGRFDNLFTAIDDRSRIFQRTKQKVEYPKHLRTRKIDPRDTQSGVSVSRGRVQSNTMPGNVAERVLNTYAPPTVHVSRDGEVLASSGSLGRYLKLSLGRAESDYVQSVALPGVREAVSSILREPLRLGRRRKITGLRARSEFGTQEFDLIVDAMADGTVLLVFLERAKFEAIEDDDIDEFEPSDSHVQNLEHELQQTQSRLYTTVEELETANEELKSSNEEMMSMNEELQSANEELSTVNDELKSKVDQLTRANADLSNFFASTDLPLVVVDSEMQIRNYTEAVVDIYPFRGADKGRPLKQVTSSLEQDKKVLDAVCEVMESGEVRQLDVNDRASEGARNWSLLITPYRTSEDKVDGATLVFTDLTEATRLKTALDIEGERLKLALRVSELGVWEYDPETREIRVDDTAGRHLDADPERHGILPISFISDRLSRSETATIDEAYRASAEQGELFEFVFSVTDRRGAERHLQAVGRHVTTQGETTMLGVLFDVTKANEAAQIRELMLREMNHRVKNLFSIISGMLRVVGRHAETAREVVEGMEDRIEALARSHDLTQKKEGSRAVLLEETVRAALEPYAGHARTLVSGPRITVADTELTSLALVLHEWATNTSKYGVLGPLSGRLEVTWKPQDDGSVKLEWNEFYDERFEPSEERAGFGATLVRIAASQLNGAVSVDQTSEFRKAVLEYGKGHDFHG